MMTSLNGIIFRVTGPSWGESTGHQWIPLTKASDAELSCFLLCAPKLATQQRVQMPEICDAIALIVTSQCRECSESPPYYRNECRVRRLCPLIPVSRHVTMFGPNVGCAKYVTGCETENIYTRNEINWFIKMEQFCAAATIQLPYRTVNRIQKYHDRSSRRNIYMNCNVITELYIISNWCAVCNIMVY